MVNKLPAIGWEFVYWYFVKVPSRLYKIFSRLLALGNNFLAVTLNIRLLFTPLFHDFTLVGRIIGFVVRLGRIILSIPILIFLAMLIPIIPVLWYLILGFSVYYLKGWALLVVIFLFASYILIKKDVAVARTTNVNSNALINAFNSVAGKYVDLISDVGIESLKKFFSYSQIHSLLIRLEVPPDKFVRKILNEEINITREFLVSTSYKYAKSHETRYIEIEHLFLAIVEGISDKDSFLAYFNTSFDLFEGVVDWVVSERERKAKKYFWQDDYKLPPISGINRGMTGRITPYLDKFSKDYTELAAYGKFNNILARDSIVQEITNILSSNHENVLLVGNAGVGKSSIVKVLARQIVLGTKHESIKFKRIVQLDAASLLSGTDNEGELGARIQCIMKDVEESDDIIVYLDEIHSLMDSGLAALLEPYMSSGDNQFIASTSMAEYRSKVDSNKAFSNLFNKVDVPEASKEETMSILKIEARNFEKEYGMIISYPALVNTIELSEKLIHDSVFPAKAVQVLDRVVASRSKASKFLGKEDVALEISKISHVPVSSIGEDESDKLLNLETEMTKRIVGQDDALKEIASAMKRSRVGIRDENKPIASFLFVGTTGVGKTQTAKALAQSYFGDADAMIRLDMSEYQQPDSINRLLGTSDGEVMGQLTEAVRNNPYSLILLDEIEKAYSKILLTFLQVMDDGRLTDAKGNTIDFSNSIIIATSNIGTRSIQKVQERNTSFEEMQNEVLNDVNENFAPEFLNRFTDIIVFRPLKMTQVKEIARLMLADVKDLAENKHIKVVFKDELIEAVAKRSFNPKLGARPLAREIEENIETYLADKILRKEINSGDTVELGLEVYSDIS